MNTNPTVTAIAVGHLCQDNICIANGFPKQNTSIHIKETEIQSGGAASQAIAAFSRLGGVAGFLGVIGKDERGDWLVKDLKKERIDTSLIDRVNGNSSFSFVYVNSKNAERTLFNYHDSLPAINFTQDKIDYIQKATFLHLDGTMYENAFEAAKIAKKANTLVSLDGCSLQSENEKNLRLVKMADILITNDCYPLALVDEKVLEKAMLKIAKFGARYVIATCGEKGCIAVKNNEIIRYPAFKIKPVDTTGAGDVFHGAFLRALELNYDLDNCIKFASAVSSINCLSIGGRKGIPSLKQTVNFINTNKFGNLEEKCL